MSVKNLSVTVLIRENTHLPTTLPLQSLLFLPGWRVLHDIDGYALGRKMAQAHWNFFYLAGATKAIVFGRERPGALRRAVRQILAKREGQDFNSLEITNVTSKRYLGIPFLSVSANSRHIQESLYLAPEKKVPAGIPAGAMPKVTLESKGRPPLTEVHTREHPVPVSSL
jgi:hypothetical protein